jgi:hypothetical protein
MLTFKQKLGLILPYARDRLIDQIKAVALIVTYLVFFQTMILGIPIAQASVIAGGLALVVCGLTFFMEGLVLGLMPLGEVIGLKLPQKSRLPVILIFSFILGMGATFAEPAISVLKAAGASVKAWEAPLLFLILNKHADILVYSVGVGVGCAVVFGMMRFMYNWSLKPFIFGLVGLLTGMSIWGYFDPNVLQLTGLAWDCGAVTTGPVTVPLVLALGIGISRVVGSGDSESGGFGVVTLASLFPILTVLLLGLAFLEKVPQPMVEKDFFASANRSNVMSLFSSDDEYYAYALQNAQSESQLSSFAGDEQNMLSFINRVSKDNALKSSLFTNPSFSQWLNRKATPAQKSAANSEGGNTLGDQFSNEVEQASSFDMFGMIKSQSMAAIQAIIPLSLFLLFTLWLVLRDKLPVKDEVFFGIALATIGMTIFNIGIELGLSKMGGQVGSVLPAAYKKIELVQNQKQIPQFDQNIVQDAIDTNGNTSRFFYTFENQDYNAVPFNVENYREEDQTYTYTPSRGPLYGTEGGITGIIVVLLFAFIMGYGATLAEPALNALGATVETITVGSFKKKLLMQSVALGVGFGILLGVAKIIWDIPLVFLLAPPYLLLMVITAISTEEFVNIGWDSAGVTTGPITVPLVLAMGLGIGGQAGVVEGFGILAMASVCPILSVLSVGLYVTSKRKAGLHHQAENIDKDSDVQPQLQKSA